MKTFVAKYAMRTWHMQSEQDKNQHIHKGDKIEVVGNALEVHKNIADNIEKINFYGLQGWTVVLVNGREELTNFQPLITHSKIQLLDLGKKINWQFLTSLNPFYFLIALGFIITYKLYDKRK